MRYAEMPFAPPPGDALPVERISPRPTLHHAPDTLETLAESIRRYGLLRPVTVRQTGSGRYVIVSGNRRLMACRMLGIACVSAYILDDSAYRQSAQRLLDALLTGRMHYLAEAEALRALHEKHGMALDELAATLNLSLTALKRQMALTALEDPLRALLLEEQVPMAIALLLLRLPEEERRLTAARRIARERLCARDSALLISSMLRSMPMEDTPAPAEPPAPPHSPGRRVIRVIRDQRLYLNAIRSIAGQMQSAGFRATLAERQISGQLEMTLRVPVRRRRMERYHQAHICP